MYPSIYLCILDKQPEIHCTVNFRLLVREKAKIHRSHKRVFNGLVVDIYSATGFESTMACFWCFDLYFVNYMSWQAEILQERAEGCIQVDLQKKIRQD